MIILQNQTILYHTIPFTQKKSAFSEKKADAGRVSVETLTSGVTKTLKSISHIFNLPYDGSIVNSKK